MKPDAGMPDGLVPDSNDHEPGHDSHAQLEPLDQLKISPDAGAVILFLPKRTTPLATAVSIRDLAANLSTEQHAAWHMQSQTGFAKTDLLQRAEDVWDYMSRSV